MFFSSQEKVLWLRQASFYMLFLFCGIVFEDWTRNLN